MRVSLLSPLVVTPLLLCGCNALFGYKPGGDGGPSSDAQADSRHPDGKTVPPGCGNGRADGSEECDGVDLRGQSCGGLGLLAGELRCSSACRYDYGGCTSCGDGQLQGVEQCDGSNLGGRSCAGLGFDAGQLGCKACKLDASGCTTPAARGRLLYGTAKELVFRLLDTAKLTWGPPVGLPVVGAPRWAVNRISPTNPDDEVAAVLAETPSDLRLHLLHFGKGGWVVDEVIALPVASVERGVRVFDLVFEASGDALLVYSDETSNPVFRTYRGGWSGEGKVFASPPGKAPVRWVKLARRPRTDEIALLYSDAETRVFGAIWTGGQFVKRTEPPGQDVWEPTTNPYGSFAACYEDQSGTLLHAAVSSCCQCLGYCTKLPATSTVFDCEGQSGACAPWNQMKMVAHEGGDEILLMGEERNVVVWRSKALGFGGEYKINNLSGLPGSDGWWADGAWTVGANPVAIVVHRGWPADWSSTSGSGRILWGKYQASKWSNGAPFTVAGMGVLSWPQLEPLSGTRVIGVFSDDKGQLWAGAHDTTAWTMIPASPIGTQLATVVTRVFSIDIRR